MYFSMEDACEASSVAEPLPEIFEYDFSPYTFTWSNNTNTGNTSAMDTLGQIRQNLCTILLAVEALGTIDNDLKNFIINQVIEATSHLYDIGALLTADLNNSDGAEGQPPGQDGSSASGPSIPEEEKEEMIILHVDNADEFIDMCKRNITPTSLDVTINRFKKVNETDVLVAAPTTHDLDVFSEIVLSVFPNVEVYQDVKREPIIVIHNTRHLTEDEIRMYIEHSTNESVKSVKVIRAHNGFNRAYVKLTRECLKALEKEDKERVFMGMFTRCRYERHIPVLRCFRCHRYGHVSAECKASDEYVEIARAIVFQNKCSNCYFQEVRNLKRQLRASELTDNEKAMIFESIDHQVFDTRCEVLCSVRRKLATRYKYD